MVEGLVNIAPFFENKFKFPWDFMGLTLPCAGSVHGYIASAIAPCYSEQARVLLAGNPALFELKRFARAYGDVFKEIADYCDRVESDRDSVAVKVLGFLATHKGFRQAFQIKIDAAYRSGSIHIPRDCEPKERWKRTSESW